jgi:predicted phosphodiesterase
MIDLTNSNERVFFIGDIHGRYDNLMKVLKEKNIKDEDCLIFLGDLINKGYQNEEVLDFVMKRKNKLVVIGNHDKVFIDYFINKQDGLKEFILSVGGLWCLDEDKREKMTEYAEWLVENSFYFIEFMFKNKHLGCCHASVPKEDWQFMKDDFVRVSNNIIWDFDRYNDCSKNKVSKPIINIDAVLFGHVPVPRIKKIDNTLYIDTGSFKIKGYYNDISCIEINEAYDLLF